MNRKDCLIVAEAAEGYPAGIGNVWGRLCNGMYADRPDDYRDQPELGSPSIQLAASRGELTTEAADLVHTEIAAAFCAAIPDAPSDELDSEFFYDAALDKDPKAVAAVFRRLAEEASE